MPTEQTPYQDITIEDVDQSVYDWFDKIVDVYVEHPSQELRKVPVLYASGERWASSSNKSGIRDKNGILILPLISVRRTSFDRDRTRLSLGTETKTFTIAKRVDKKTNTVQNAISSRDIGLRRSNGKVVHEITTIPFPDWSVTNYEVVIQTQYILQMNKILEKIVNSFSLQNQIVMPLNVSKFESDHKDIEFEERKPLKGYYFVGFIDTDLSDSGNFEEFTDQERIVKYTFNIQVPTYLQLDPEGNKPSIQVQETAYEISFPDECVKFSDDPDFLDEIFSYKKPQ